MATYNECEAAGRNFLIIYKGNEPLTDKAICVDSGTPDNPNIIKDIQLDPGEYIADLIEPRTPQEIALGKEQGNVSSYEFTVYPIPKITYTDEIVYRQPDFYHRITYYIDGQIINEIEYSDGRGNTEIVTSNTLVKDYLALSAVDNTYDISFTIKDTVRIGNLRFEDQVIRPFGGPFTPEYPLQPVLASRIVNGQRELIYHIVGDKLILDTRGSIGVEGVINIDGIEEHFEGDKFDIFTLQLPITELSVSARGGPYPWELWDTLTLSNINPEEYNENNNIYGLKILKQDSNDLKAGYVEYINPELKDGAKPQKIGSTNYDSQTWDQLYPFTRIKPCWVRKDGFVDVYFKRDDFTQIETIEGSDGRIEELQAKINEDQTVLRQYQQTRLEILANDPFADVSELDQQISELSALIFSEQEELAEEIRSSLLSQKITYIPDPVPNRLKRTDGNLMVEFPNLYYDTFEDSQWIYIKISDRKVEDFWLSTNTRIENGQEIIHDTIYLGVFYSNRSSKEIDGTNYNYFNSNTLATDYTGIDASIDNIKYLGSNFDAFSIQNLLLLRLLWIFRFCSTELVNIPIKDRTATKDTQIHPYDYSHRFASLDYPFGFGIKTNIQQWALSKELQGFTEGIITTPAVFNGYFGFLSSTQATFNTSQGTTYIPEDFQSIPNDYKISDKLTAQILYGNRTDSSFYEDEHITAKIDSYNTKYGWTKPLDIYSDTNELPLMITPVDGNENTFNTTFGHTISQIGNLYNAQTGEQYPAWNYDPLIRAVWWKPNENYILDVLYPEILYANENNPYAKLDIVSNSTGWKQDIVVDGVTYTQKRINRPFTNADSLAANIAVGFPLGDYSIDVLLYNTNDIPVEEKHSIITVKQPPIGINKNAVYTPEKVILQLYKDNGTKENLIYDVIYISLVKKNTDGTETILDTFEIDHTTQTTDEYELNLTESCTIKVLIVGDASPEGIVVEFPVKVDENYLEVEPISGNEDLIRFTKQADNWEIIGYYGFEATFKISNSVNNILFYTDQPVDGKAQDHPLPTTNDPGNYSVTDNPREFILENLDNFHWVFPYGNGSRYQVKFISRNGITEDYTQTINIISIDKNNPNDDIAILNYNYTYTQNKLTINFDGTKGQKLIIDWGDGQVSEPYTTFTDKVHLYTQPGEYRVFLTLTGAYDTRIVDSFFTSKFSPIYTVRIDESKLYQNSNLLEYRDEAVQFKVPEDVDKIYPFDSISPVLMDGLNVLCYLDKDNWLLEDDGTDRSQDVLEYNTMIEIPRFFYKIEKNGQIIDVSICADKIDDSWQNIFGESNSIYIGALLASNKNISLQNDTIRFSKDILESTNEVYEPIKYNVITALQALFLLKYCTLNSTSIFEGDNPQDVNGLINQLGGDMGRPGKHVRFLGIDNLWGIRPTLLNDISIENNTVVIDGNTYLCNDNSYIDRPIINAVIGDNTAGFFPANTEGLQGQRYFDVGKFNNSGQVFFGVMPSYDPDFNDNGIFAIGNRTPIDNSYIEYFVERDMVKTELPVNSIRNLIGEERHIPLRCIFVPGTLRIELTKNRAYKYILKDSLNSQTVFYDPKVKPTVIEQEYIKSQPITDNRPMDIDLFMIDKLDKIQHIYPISLWIRNLDSDIDIGPDVFTLDDPVIVNATKLQTLDLRGPLAKHITVDWGDNSPPESMEVTEGQWIFKHYYRDTFIDGQGTYSVTVTVDGGTFSNGGVVIKDLHLTDLVYWYTFESIAGYARTLENGEIVNNGYTMNVDFTDSMAQYIMFHSDQTILLDDVLKEDLIRKNIMSPEMADKICDGSLHVKSDDENFQIALNNGELSLSYTYMNPGVYFPRFILWGNEVTIEGTMRIVALDYDEVLPQAEFDWKHDENDFSTLVIEPIYDATRPNAKTVKIDWGDGTTLQFNPAYSSMWIAAQTTTAKLCITQENDLFGNTNIGANIEIKTIHGDNEEIQSGHFMFNGPNMEEFSQWINDNFTHVRAVQNLDTGYILDNNRELWIDSYVILQAVVSGKSTIEVNIAWDDVDNTIDYKGIILDRSSLYTIVEGDSGIVSKDIAYPPSHKYNWAGIFEVTYTAYGDQKLEDTRKISFNSYPVYGVVAHDEADATLKELQVSYTYDSQYVEESADPRQSNWDNIWMFQQTKPVLFDPAKGVLKYINPDNYYQDIDGNNIVNDVTGAYLDDMKKVKRNELIQGGMTPEQADVELLDWVFDKTLFRGDVMIELPNMYYNFHREKFNPYPYYQSSIYNISNRPYPDITDCIMIEISDRKLEQNWGATSTYKGKTQKRSYISAYHGSFEKSWGGMRSLALKSYHRESFSGMLREANASGYDLMTWNQATFLQLLFMLRNRSMDVLDITNEPQRHWGDFGTLNQLGMYPVKTDVRDLGTYKFAGILEPASGTMGSWIEGITVSNKHYLFNDDGTPIKEPYAENTDPIPAGQLDTATGNVLAWETIQNNNPDASVNSSYYLPLYYYNTDTNRWNVRRGTYVGDNDWAFFPTADVLIDPDIRKVIKWGTDPEHDLFSGTNATDRGGVDEITNDNANMGDYALLSYNNTEPVDDDIMNYREFDYIVDPIKAWQGNALNFKIENTKYFLDDDKIIFVFGDGNSHETTIDNAINGIDYIYEYPGHYIIQCVILDKNDSFVNKNEEYTIPIDLYGINVQVLDTDILTYEQVGFYCQLSYGDRIEFDPGDGTPIQTLYKDTSQDNSTINWIFFYRYTTAGNFTAKITVYGDDKSMTENIDISVIDIYAEITTQIPTENINPAGEVQVNTPILFHFDNCIGKLIEFYPDSVGEPNNKIIIEKPYRTIYTYTTLGQKTPMVKVYGDIVVSDNFASDTTTITIYAEQPTVEIEARGLSHWNTQPITFDITSKFYQRIVVTSLNKANNVVATIFDTDNVAAGILTFNYLFPVGEYTITATATGYYGEIVQDSIDITVTLHQVHLNIINGEPVTTISGIVPITVNFSAPNTTTDLLIVNYGDGNTANITRTVDNPNFDNTYTYIVPGVYYPYASIVVDDNGTIITSNELLSVNVNVPIVGNVIFPDGGYAPKTVEVIIQDALSQNLTIDFDADPTDTPQNKWDYTQIKPGYIDGDTDHVYTVQTEEIVKVSHTYTKPGNYYIRVCTNYNNTEYDTQIDGIITIEEIFAGDGDNYKGYLPLTVRIDRNEDIGEWIEINPGDYRTYDFTGMTQEQRKEKIFELYRDGIKIVTLENNGIDIPYCIIYYKTNTTINGKPWIFNITYDKVGNFTYEVNIFSEHPYYDYLDDNIEI